MIVRVCPQPGTLGDPLPGGASHPGLLGIPIFQEEPPVQDPWGSPLTGGASSPGPLGIPLLQEEPPVQVVVVVVSAVPAAADGFYWILTFVLKVSAWLHVR